MRNASRSILLCSALLASVAASELLAQSTTRVQRRDPVRRAVIDLEAQAAARRAGQVMPGDEAPVSRLQDDPTPASEHDTDGGTPPETAAPIIDLFENEPREEAPPEQPAPAKPTEPATHTPPVASSASPVSDPVSELSDTIAPAAVRVIHVDGPLRQAEWSLDTAQQRWQPITPGNQSIGIVTIRTGPATRVRLALHHATQVTISSLSKVQLGTVTRYDGSEVSYVRVLRGSALVQPAQSSPAQVPVAIKSGDTRWLVSHPAIVRFDAIDGAAIDPAPTE